MTARRVLSWPWVPSMCWIAWDWVGGGCREDAGAMWTASISSSVSLTLTHTPQKEPEGSLAKGAARSESGGKCKL